MLLAGKVEVEGAAHDTRGLGDARDLGLAVARAQELRDRGLEDPLAGIGALALALVLRLGGGAGHLGLILNKSH